MPRIRRAGVSRNKPSKDVPSAVSLTTSLGGNRSLASGGLGFGGAAGGVGAGALVVVGVGVLGGAGVPPGAGAVGGADAGGTGA
ncbi:hypothetical protein MishRS11D_27680 [Methylomagnum ishizawai]|nr:hypothetical protein MishRS11D_27680 [Methylomagnum ishizawai]